MTEKTETAKADQAAPTVIVEEVVAITELRYVFCTPQRPKVLRLIAEWDDALMQSIMLRRLPGEAGFELLDGCHRLSASRALGLPTIRARIFPAVRFDPPRDLRPCSRCRRLFKPTAQRWMLCQHCFRSDAANAE